MPRMSEGRLAAIDRAAGHMDDAFCQAVQEIIADLREAREDTARLDYLEKNRDVYYQDEPVGFTMRTTDHDFMEDPEFARGDTLRQVIDAARKETT